MKTAALHKHSSFILTFGVQHLGDVQVLLGHLEGVVQVGYGVVLKRWQQRRTMKTRIHADGTISNKNTETFLRLS